MTEAYGGSLTMQQSVDVFKAVWAAAGGTDSHTIPQPPFNTSPGGHAAEQHAGRMVEELVEEFWWDWGIDRDGVLTIDRWEALMEAYLHRNAERTVNMFVVNATTPAQLFHVLRRQVLCGELQVYVFVGNQHHGHLFWPPQVNMPCIKPLVLFSPKYLLHHKPATSALSDFSTGTQFFRVIDDGRAGDNTRHRAHDPVTGKPYLLPNECIRRVVMCSGQMYYFLSRQRRARKIRDIALVRLEQLAPFPHDILLRVLQQYSNAEIVWCQEEPKNMGAYAYVRPRLQAVLREEFATGQSKQVRRVRYVGRAACASPATASASIHKAEIAHVVDVALHDGSDFAIYT